MSAGESHYVRCPNCGEQNPPTRTLCWLCYSALQRKSLGARAPSKAVFEGTVKDSTASMIALAVVCLGVLLIAPGLGIAMAILMIFPFIRTSVLVRRRAEEGRPTSTASSALMLLGSVFLSAIVLTVVGVVAFGTFCLTCLGANVASKNDVAAMVVASGATITVVAIMGYFIFRWIRWSWYQDLRK